MSEKTVSLILAFLYTKKSKIFSNIHTSTHEGRIPYISVTFNYTGSQVDILVYNDAFIKVNVDKKAWAICDGIKTLRDAIYKIESYNYGRDD
jgi:hypothetical protein